MKNALIVQTNDNSMQRFCRILTSAFKHIDISCANSIAEATKMCHKKQFSLALLDIKLQDGSGINLLSDLKLVQPSTYFVILTIFDNDEYVFDALKHGALGYILSGQKDFEIVKLFQGILDGAPPLSPVISIKILKHFSLIPDKNNTNLSNQEVKVLTLVAKGYTKKEVRFI